ncbi:MAG: calcium-binding protein [Phenylobacterium sp.]
MGGETVIGGAGSDTLSVVVSTDLSAIGLSGLEVLSVTAGQTATLAASQAGAFTTISGGAGSFADILAASGVSFTLPALTVTGAMIRVLGASGDETLSGAGGGESLSALAGADSLAGEGGADTLAGGSGMDHLAGGAGSDVFVFGITDSGLTEATADRITDFATGSDRLSLGVAGNAAAGTGNYVEAGSAVTDFAAALAAAETALSALNGTAGGRFGKALRLRVRRDERLPVHRHGF